MIGTKVIYNNEIYIVLHDYGNGQIEIRKEQTILYSEIQLVKIDDVMFLNEEKD
ncbi:hypothetical protein [Alkalihalobacterium chitinilyticum]|uniref:Uncharacterized protein n=1 Tax=Alkalihalobacterium chitinilyticum TaxID=2980103 RepID=A0ABT5VCP6_9BACI|nr:hypothetical protein [Alkalihalobacterium chitinilyticum]MDE5413226.1 hypothetical protein [Alkalihalobacterium chitinilyticum]